MNRSVLWEARGGQESLILARTAPGYPATMPGGDQVLVPDYQASEVLLRDFRE